MPAVCLAGTLDATIASGGTAPQQAAAGGTETLRPDDRIQAELVTAWTSLPRPRLDQVRQVLASPEAVALATLLRSTTFNPRDVHLAVASRRDIDGVLATVRNRACRLAQEYAAAKQHEFEQARARGCTTPIDFARAGGDLLLAPLGADPFFEVIEGVTHGIAQADMPRSSVLRDQQRTLGVGLVAQLAAAFENAGTLTAGERLAVARRARQIFDNTRRRR